MEEGSLEICGVLDRIFKLCAKLNSELNRSFQHLIIYLVNFEAPSLSEKCFWLFILKHQVCPRF